MMAEKRRRGILAWALPWLIVLGIGFAGGYYVRDRQHDRDLRAAVAEAREEMRRAGLEAIGRAQRAGGDFSAGARAAAESTRAAFEELMGRGDQEQ